VQPGSNKVASNLSSSTLAGQQAHKRVEEEVEVSGPSLPGVDPLVPSSLASCSGRAARTSSRHERQQALSHWLLLTQSSAQWH
jgi:hypothetical protein